MALKARSRSLLTVALLLAGCAADPPRRTETTRTPDLVVPRMPEAGAPAAPHRKKTAPVEEERVSYEEALVRAQAEETVTVSADEPDMTDGELAAPMRNATFVSGCGAPDSMKLTVKVAVRRGRAVGVTVRTHPPNEVIARCVDEHVRRDLRWPEKQKLDTFTVTY